jgi:hypothetical protein
MSERERERQVSVHCKVEWGVSWEYTKKGSTNMKQSSRRKSFYLFIQSLFTLFSRPQCLKNKKCKKGMGNSETLRIYISVYENGIETIFISNLLFAK